MGTVSPCEALSSKEKNQTIIRCGSKIKSRHEKVQDCETRQCSTSSSCVTLELLTFSVSQFLHPKSKDKNGNYWFSSLLCITKGQKSINYKFQTPLSTVFQLGSAHGKH